MMWWYRRPLVGEHLDLGTKYAPEFACIPFKILLGSYLEAIDLEPIPSLAQVG